MDLDSYYSAAAALVERDAELQRARYKTKDGRYVISSSDLRLLSMRGHISPDEYVSGLDLEKITLEEATRLVSEGGYAIGQQPDGQDSEGGHASERDSNQESTAAQPEPGSEDSIDNNQTEEDNSNE